MTIQKLKVIKQRKPDVFAEDETNTVFDLKWSAEELLAQAGVFFLKDVVKILKIDPAKIKKAANRIRDDGGDSYKVMGARKIFDRWVVRIEVFASYYVGNLIPKVQKVKPEWDGNLLLTQKGIYFLSDVCALLPITNVQLRYQAHRTADSRRKFGVWRDEELKTFLVDMAIFGPWLGNYWREITNR